MRGVLTEYTLRLTTLLTELELTLKQKKWWEQSTEVHLLQVGSVAMETVFQELRTWSPVSLGYLYASN